MTRLRQTDRTANAEYMRRYRAAKAKPKVRELPPHGTRDRYQWKDDPCRCDDCTAANTAYTADYRQRRKQGDRSAESYPGLRAQGRNAQPAPAVSTDDASRARS